MTAGVFFAVLVAAVLHAGWNAGVKTGTSKQNAMLILTVWQGIIGFAGVIWLPWPAPQVWPWLIASGVVHMIYQLFLAYAYEQGDLSRVYPLARGAAPLMVLVFSVFFLPDIIGIREYAGIAVLAGGIILMARGALLSGESRRLIPYALGAACATAGYTVIDGIGARVGGDPVVYVAWLLLLAAFFYVPAVLVLKGRKVVLAPAREWARGSLLGLASMGAYGIVVWAMTEAPIALVAALRETSILFAVFIGWLWFGDRMDRIKIMAAGLIVAGVVLTRV